MAASGYRKLIEDFCVAAGISDPDRVLRGSQLRIDGMAIQLEYIEADDQCRVAIDLGPIPEAVERDCHRLMLAWNVEPGADGMQIMGIDPESGRATLVLRIPLSLLEQGGGLFALLDERLDPVREAWEDLLDELGMPPPRGEAFPALGQLA